MVKKVSLKRHYVWHPFTFINASSDELTNARFNKIFKKIVSGNGIYLEDRNGNKFINTCSSLWNVSLGLGNKEIIDAGKTQLKELAFHSLFRSSHNSAEHLARELVKISPKNLDLVFFSNSGSEAVETAIKAARLYFFAKGYKQKKTIIYLKDAYHGTTYGSMFAFSKEEKEPYSPTLAGFTQIINPYCYRCPLKKRYPECDLACADILKSKIRQIGKEKIAGLIIEPVQGVAGVIVPPNGYLKKIERICRENNMLLIFDEITTGFGRLGKMFAATLWKIKPDIICLSKGINSGYIPLGATLFKAKIYNTLVRNTLMFNHGSTSAGHPVACAAALATIKILKKGLLKKVKEKSKFFMRELGRLSRLALVGDIRGVGLMIGVELIKDQRRKTRLSEIEQVQVTKLLEKQGLFVYMMNSCLFLLPPLIVTKKQIRKIVSILEKTFAEIKF